MEYSLGLIPDLFTSSILFSAAGLALKFLFWLISFFFFCYLFVDSFEQFSPSPFIDNSGYSSVSNALPGSGLSP